MNVIITKLVVEVLVYVIFSVSTVLLAREIALYIKDMQSNSTNRQPWGPQEKPSEKADVRCKSCDEQNPIQSSGGGHHAAENP